MMKFRLRFWINSKLRELLATHSMVLSADTVFTLATSLESQMRIVKRWRVNNFTLCLALTYVSRFAVCCDMI